MRRVGVSNWPHLKAEPRRRRSPTGSTVNRFRLSGALCTLVLAVAGCSSTPRLPTTAGPAAIEVAFSPDAGAEALVLRVVGSAQQSIRLAGYSFTSPAVVKALTEAQRRKVDVRVILDDKGNRGKANIAAMNLLLGAGVQVRVNARYAIHHDKYIVVDERTVQTGSFNYSAAAARSNSENVMVVWNDTAVASRYLGHWAQRWAQGIAVEMSY